MSELGGSNHNKKTAVNRRTLLKSAVVTAASALSSDVADAQPANPLVVTEAEIANACTTIGLKYTEAERKQMASIVTRSRSELENCRSAEVDFSVDPAIRFDPIISGFKLPKGSSSCTLSKASVKATNYSGDIESLAFFTVADISRLIKARKVSSVQLTEMYLARLKSYGPKLICVVNLCEDRALKQAAAADKEISDGRYRGPLHGIPWGAKDLLATRGVPTTWGAKPYEHQMFDIDATVVQRLDAAGAVLVAKLSMGELAMGDVWFGGKTRTPWNPAQGSSGSSAGPGSATAAGLVGFAIGTETLGSIVSPSVVNGVTGLRPTFGRVSRYGAMALSWTMDKIGPMCRGVEDCALVLNAIRGSDGLDRSAMDVPFRWNPARKLDTFKYGIDRAAFDSVAKNPARNAAYAQALKTIEALGVTLVPVDIPAATEVYQSIAEIVINSEGAAAFMRLNKSGGLSLLAQQSNNSWPNLFRAGSLVPAADYLHAMQLRHKLQREWSTAMGDLDGFVTVPFAGSTLVYTNLTGHPTLITRCGMQDGNPLSLEICGGLYREEAILRLGYAFEQSTDWHKQWPDMCRVV